MNRYLILLLPLFLSTVGCTPETADIDTSSRESSNVIPPSNTAPRAPEETRVDIAGQGATGQDTDENVASVTATPYARANWDKSESGFPKIEGTLSEIAESSKLKLLISKTGYFNHAHHNDSEPGAYFQLALSDEVLKQVIDKLALMPQKNSHDTVRRMLTQFPYNWPKLNLDDCTWFGGKYDTEDHNYGELTVLVADYKSQKIFVLRASWCYIP